jgi:hypothetical protein
VGGRRFAAFSALWVMVGLVAGLSSGASADHKDDTPCTDDDPSSYRGSGIGQFTAGNWPNGVLGRDGARVHMHTYDPRDQGYKDHIVHSIYIYESDDDFIETGFWQDENYFASPSLSGVVFAVRVFAGGYIQSPHHPLPWLEANSDHTLKIERNPNGGAPARYEFSIDGDQWGHYAQSNMQSGGAVVAGVENFDSCEDLRMHAWNMDLQLTNGGAFSSWGSSWSVIQKHTKWWRDEGNSSTPEWWVQHCPNDPWCNDTF